MPVRPGMPAALPNCKVPALTTVSPVYVLLPPRVNWPAVVLFRPTPPVRLAVIVPNCPSNATDVLVSVPSWRVPPWMLTVPEVVWPAPVPPRSRAPPE